MYCYARFDPRNGTRALQDWSSLAVELRMAAAVVVDGVAGPDGLERASAASAWAAWVEQRIDAAGRALWKYGWQLGSWNELTAALQGAAACVGTIATWLTLFTGE